MLKQITMVECDVCGATEKAIKKFNRNEEYYDLPSGWMHSDVNRNFCICPKCLEKLSKK